MNIQPLFDKIAVDHNQEEVWDKVQEAKSDFLDENWEEDFDDIDDAYAETGRGEAESQTIVELITMATHGYPISDSDHCVLFDKLKEHYELSTD